MMIVKRKLEENKIIILFLNVIFVLLINFKYIFLKVKCNDTKHFARGINIKVTIIRVCRCLCQSYQ